MGWNGEQMSPKQALKRTDSSHCAAHRINWHFTHPYANVREGVVIIPMIKCKSHRRQHTGEKPFKCNECGHRLWWETATSLKSVTRHSVRMPISVYTWGAIVMRNRLSVKSVARHSVRMANSKYARCAILVRNRWRVMNVFRNFVRYWWETVYL